MGMYLYMNEPRAAPHSSRTVPRWPESEGLTALGTSHPAVRAMDGRRADRRVRQVPDLAGVCAITASENLTDCASHGD